MTATIRRDLKKYLNEGKSQVLELIRGIDHLDVHNSKYTVRFLLYIGTILNDIEETLKSKKEYMSWIRKNFKHNHLRCFQQAKQLAKNADFVNANASLGKNRLLEFLRIKKDDTQSYGELLSSYPFADTTEDMDGELFKEHIDTVITFRRLNEAGIDFVEFAQAGIIASSLHHSIQVGKAKIIFEWLKNQENAKEAFEDFLLNRLEFPYGVDRLSTGKNQSLNKILAGLVDYRKRADLENDEWVKSQRDLIADNIITEAYEFILNLSYKFEITLPAETGSEESTTQNEKEA